MNLHQFRFVQEAVRRNLNLTEAAKALHTSQPGVSKAIIELEEELGIEIFARHGKRLKRITEPGQHVLQSIEVILPLVGAKSRDVVADRALRVFRRAGGATGHERRGKCSGNKKPSSESHVLLLFAEGLLPSNVGRSNGFASRPGHKQVNALRFRQSWKEFGASPRCDQSALR